MNPRRSASVGALPHEKKHFVSRNESASGVSLDVRCACQYFQCDSLLPERINPVDSRPSSQLGFHSDLSQDEQLFLESTMPPHDLRAYQFGTHTTGPAETLPVVDLSFVEKHPELEETAKKRGLVVRSISDANEPDQMIAMSRGRQMSVGGFSAGYGRRDLDTMSTHSGTSLRRLPSRSPSRKDLFVADINIPTHHRGSSVSASVSRRTSNADLTQFLPPHRSATPLVFGQMQQSAANLRISTQNSNIADISSEFVNDTGPIQDYRIAKTPVSTDYMRPSDNKENLGYIPVTGEILPQHRPINIGKSPIKNNLEMADVTNVISDFERVNSRASSPAPLAPISSKSETLSATNGILQIQDDIELETIAPLSLDSKGFKSSIVVNKETDIDILRTEPVVDIEKLVKEEKEKAMETRMSPKPPPRHRSPTPKRQLSPIRDQVMDTLELPSSKRTQSALKRQHTPERAINTNSGVLDGINKSSTATSINQPHMVTLNGAISLQDASPEVKSYASRFKAMFGSQKPDAIKEASPKRQRSTSPSPKREKSPSPAPNKLISMFSKNKSAAIEITSGSNAAVAAKPEEHIIATQVTETFSLKVDEMDQYSFKPKQPPPQTSSLSQLNTPLQTTYSSREDIAKLKYSSTDMSDAFAPIILSQPNIDTFFAGSRNLYSADIDMQRSTGTDSNMRLRHHSNEPSTEFGSNMQIPKGVLISMPIHITGQESKEGFKHSLYRSPSEQKVRAPTPSFHDGRTQSQDRARIPLSQDDLSAPRMSKTVSFNFDERKSRLTDYEKSVISQQKQEQFDFLERSYFTRDHEYEPIGVHSTEDKEASSHYESHLPTDTQTDSIQQAQDLQRDFEERYFSSETTTPRTESRTDYEIHTSQIDSSALEELPLKPENRKKGFMASAQDRTRRMQVGFKTQAGKIKTKLRSPAKKPPTRSDSPKDEKRRRFKAPEFSKIKMPEIKRPDISKFKDFKRPEFTKFNTTDMSKFKFTDKFSMMKLRRSKSFKENEPSFDDDVESGVKPVSAPAEKQQKKMFDFNFGTYPRAFRKKKAPLEPQSSFGTEEPSIIPSTETQPSMNSSSSPKGDRGPGPVRSRWADKFSDVSYNDSEGSRYRRYESELGSFDRESSLEQRMKDDLEDTGSEVGPDLGILSGADDTKQFAEFDEENRAIHEISSQRAGEFKRRPMVHQDSDIRSEDSKDLGWTDKEIQKNKLLRKAEIEAESSYLKYPSEESRHDNLSTASSGKKVVMEQIDDDEFFLRKRGVSEDNIEFRQYISNAIRQGYDMPINALQHVGKASSPMKYDEFDAPPPKPRRLQKSQRPEDVSQEFHSRSEFGDDLSISQNGSDFYPPKRPLRKGRSQSKYSVDSQDIPITAEHFISRGQYFDDDEEYLRPTRDQELNNLDKKADTNIHDQPQPPRRRKRRENSIDKDAYVNGLTGRSVSSSYLQPNEDVIVYRTEHQYPVPLATPENYTDGSRSVSRFDENEHVLHIVDGSNEVYEKYVIDMMENDGYATVRKEQIPKPTPPARRKKFSRTPGFGTLPNQRSKRSSTSPPERPPPPRDYSPSEETSRPQPPRRKSTLSLETQQK